MNNWQKLLERPTEELITLYQGGPPLDKEGAFHVLVHRFREDLLKKCEVMCGKLGHGPDVAEIITENVFLAYARKGQFKINQSKGKEVNESFKLYLYGIAKYQLIDYYRKQIRGEQYDGTEILHHDWPETVIAKAGSMVGEPRIIYETVKALPQSHRTIYLTYKAYEKAGINLPKKLQSELREHLGNVQQNTIRTYKKEANDKIQQALDIYRLSQKISA